MALKTLTGKLLLSRQASGGESVCESLGASNVTVDLSRTWRRVKHQLLEVELQQIWQDGKARAKQQLSALVGSGSGAGGTQQAQRAPPEALLTPAQQPDALTPAAPAVSQAQLDEMYGTNGWLRSAVLSVIGHASQAFMQQANHVSVEGAEHMRAALQRPAGQALITVCNHVAALDDPLVVASLLPADMLDQPERLRWTLCATDRCFRYKMLAPFFTAAKVLPVQRGGGLHQPGMVAAEQRLQQGDWVQVFPEGTRSRDPTRMGRVRPGVGRLVAAAASAPDAPPPLVLPFAHAGMENVMPVGSKLPSVGQQVRVVVGEPVQVADLLQQAREEQWEQPQLYSAIASRVESSLQQLHARAQGSLAAATLGAQAVLREVDGVYTAAAVSGDCTSSSSSHHGTQLPVESTSSASGPSAVVAPDALGWRQQAGDNQGSGWWGPAQLRKWEHAAFSMWHHSWAERLAVVQAAARVNYQQSAAAV